MRPLSVINYARNNKKKVIPPIICVAVAVCFVYSIYILRTAIYNSMDTLALPLECFSGVMQPSTDKAISFKTIDKIRKEESTERILPVQYGSTSFFSLLWDFNVPVMFIKIEDMSYFMEKLQVELVQGRLPRRGENEIVIDYRIAKNRKVRLGDSIGLNRRQSEAPDGKYKIVGILKGESGIAFSSYDTQETGEELFQYGMLVFHKKDKLAASNEFLSKIKNEEAVIITYEIEKDVQFKELEKKSNQMINLIVVFTILVMIVSVGSSVYSHFMQRKKEFEILGAMGYNKLFMLKKIFIEVGFMNFIGFILGLVLAVAAGYLVNIFYLMPKGMTASLCVPYGAMKALCIPIFVAFFATIAIYKVIVNSMYQ